MFSANLAHGRAVGIYRPFRVTLSVTPELDSRCYLYCPVWARNPTRKAFEADELRFMLPRVSPCEAATKVPRKFVCRARSVDRLENSARS